MSRPRVGGQPADRAAGVHGGEHGAVRREDEAGRLEVARVVVEVGAGRGGDLERVGAVPDREGELVPGGERGGGRLVVHRQRDDLDAEFSQRLGGPGEGRELRVAVGAPRAAVDQDDAVGAPSPGSQMVPPPTAGTESEGNCCPFCRRDTGTFLAKVD